MAAQLIIAAAVFSAVACSKQEPEATLDRMIKASCAGDKAGFFEHADRKKMKEAVGRQPGLAGMGEAASQVIFQFMANEVDKKENGSSCQMKLLKVEDGPDGARIATMQYVSGNQQRWVFKADESGKWKVVELMQRDS